MIACIKTMNTSNLCGKNALSEHTARHCFQKFRLSALFLCDKCNSGQPQFWDGEALEATIEENNCGEVAKCFRVSDETVRLEKVYKLSKWLPYTLSEVNKQQHVDSLFLVAFSVSQYAHI